MANFFSRWLEKLTPPASKKFFLLLKEQAAGLAEAAKILQSSVDQRTLGTREFTARIHAHENKVDLLTDRFRLAVRQTLIHPVDPDDLLHISNVLDSAVDTMDHVAWRMEAYRLSVTPRMAGLIRVIVQMCGELNALFDHLVRNDSAGVDEKYRRLYDLEKESDRLFHEGVRDIHASGELAFTVEDEILQILETCADQCDEAGQTVVVMLERNR